MASKEYWRKREEENLKKNLKTEEAYIKEVRSCYDYMMNQIQKEIDGFYTKYAKKEGITLAEAKKRVSKLDMEAYERKAAKYVKEKDFSDEANEEMRLYNATMKINRLELLKANIGLELVDGFNGLQKYYGQVLAKRTLQEFERLAGILGKTVQDNAQAAHAIVNASFHNAKFSDRIWMYQDMLKSELSKLLQEGLIQGRNPRQLARHLKKLFGVSAADAERLMRTELARVQTEAQKQSFIRNGYEEYEFIALGNACGVCKELDGKHFKVKDMMPGTNAPPMHPNCRCSTAAHMDDKEYEEWLSEQENVENSGENDTIKMYRKGSTHRKISESGSKIIDMATYHSITNPAIKKGADIRIAKDDVLKRLKEQEATAVTYGDVIYFREDATVSDVLEEVYHFEQNRKGMNSQYDFKQRMILNEIDAKQYLLSVTDKYHIPPEETELTRAQLAFYRKQMEDMKERGEWSD
ncbi:minor capsid protein [Faecalimonas umbilicata]|nr:minor capsid protein [Faecalimonas umbilicata]